MGMIANFRSSVSTGLQKMGFFGGFNRGYDGGRHDIAELNGWNPGLGFSDNDHFSQNGTITGRARDLDKNNAWINGAIDRRVESVIGTSIRLSAQPMHELLGQDYDWRMKWTADVQAKFRVFANDVHKRCDSRGKLHLGSLARLAYIQYIVDGEVGGEIRMNSRGARFATNVMLVDCDRLSNPNGKSNEKRLRNGVEFDANSRPTGYWIRKAHPNDPTPGIEQSQWTRIPAYGRTGKPRFVHVFNPRRVEQGRGVSRLVEAIVPAKMIDRVDRAEVNASMLSAIMSFFIKSPETTDDIEQAIAPGSEVSNNNLAEYIDYRSKKPVRVGNGAQIQHLLPGEDVVVPKNGRPNANYADFQKFVLQKISSSFGLSYPQLAQDWEGVNYSSARALLNEMWRSFLQDREFFTQQFLTPIYAAWMEEAVAMGEVELPGGPTSFYTQKTELTMCEWIGPGRGSVDPLKEANANNLEVASGRKSTAQLIREDGREPMDVMAEESWYLDEREKRGLDAPNFNVKAESGSGEGEGGGTAEDRDGDGEANEAEKKKDSKKERQG